MGGITMNKNTKKGLFITVFTAISFATCGYLYADNTKMQNVELHAYRAYLTSDQVEDNADLIVIGVPTESFEDATSHVEYQDNGRIEKMYTSRKFEVTKVFKGDGDVSEKEIITIYEPAAIIDGKKVYTEDYEILHKGQKYLMFLQKVSEGNYRMVCDTQGTFNLNQEKTVRKHNLNIAEKHINELREIFLGKYQE
jgi:hypothetical protein